MNDIRVADTEYKNNNMELLDPEATCPRGHIKKTLALRKKVVELVLLLKKFLESSPWNSQGTLDDALLPYW